MKKKVLKSESMPEFDEGIKNMSEYNKGRIDGIIASHPEIKQTNSQEIIIQVNDMVEKPFVTEKFGDKWKEHTKQMLIEGQQDIDSIINIAWKQGRRAILMERAIKQLID